MLQQQLLEKEFGGGWKEDNGHKKKA